MPLSGAIHFKAEAGGVCALAFSATGHHLFTGGGSGALTEWSLRTRIPVRLFEGHKGALNGFDQLPDGSRLVTAGADKAARLWCGRSGAELACYRGHKSAVITALFSPAGHQVITLGADGQIGFWEEDSARLLCLTDAAPAAFAVTLSDGGLLYAGAHGRLITRAPATGEILNEILGPKTALSGLAVSPSHPAVAVLTAEGELSLFALEDGAVYERWQVGAGLGAGLGFSPDGGLLFCAGREGLAGFDLRSGQRAFSLPLALKPPLALALSAQGELIALGAGDGQTHVLPLAGLLPA